METIYIKRLIKSEADLPKEEGYYFVFSKEDDYYHDGYDVWFYRNNEINDTSWLLFVIWYLQPVTLAELVADKLGISI